MVSSFKKNNPEYHYNDTINTNKLTINDKSIYLKVSNITLERFSSF